MSFATLSARETVAFEAEVFRSQPAPGRWVCASQQARARRLLRLPIEFIPSRLFPLQPNFPLPSNLAGGGRLTADEEAAMFRWMNFLKYRASTLRAVLRPERPHVALMNEIERLLDGAVEVRNQLLGACSKLPFCVARAFGHGGYLLEELESEAHATLLRAAERFDADRGFRFTTYATHAIRRNLCRYLRRRRKEMSRMLLLPHMDVVKDDRRSSVEFERWLAKSNLILREMIGRLDAREQLIIRSRFGLGEHPGSQTLQAIADQLALSRERVRQVERRALAKLRQMAHEHGLSEPDAMVDFPRSFGSTTGSGRHVAAMR